MCETNYVTSIPVFNGFQGKFYIVDRYKYHIRFPIEWALDHKVFQTGKRKEFIEGTGPKECGNCRAYGSIRGVFVGYCGTCIDHYDRAGFSRGEGMGGFSIDMLSCDCQLWRSFPYMTGIKLSEIGDNEEQDLEIADDAEQEFTNYDSCEN